MTHLRIHFFEDFFTEISTFLGRRSRVETYDTEISVMRIEISEIWPLQAGSPRPRDGTRNFDAAHARTHSRWSVYAGKANLNFARSSVHEIKLSPTGGRGGTSLTKTARRRARAVRSERHAHEYKKTCTRRDAFSLSCALKEVSSFLFFSSSAGQLQARPSFENEMSRAGNQSGLAITISPLVVLDAGWGLRATCQVGGGENRGSWSVGLLTQVLGGTQLGLAAVWELPPIFSNAHFFCCFFFLLQRFHSSNPIFRSPAILYRQFSEHSQ